jgi:tetraprenyl-beta-curcumene synthase
MSDVIDEISWAVRNVLTSPARLRFLTRDGPATTVRLLAFLGTVVPRARAQLALLRQEAERIPDPALRREAVASIEGKAYHVAGACILATFLPSAAAEHYIEIVAPLETIYDYLDNLCDRHPNVPAQAYPVLHEALADALDPSAAPRDYYRAGPPDDGGYLQSLVTRVQRSLRRLAGYEDLLPYFREAAAFYAEMQTFKHFPPGERETALVEWYERNRERFEDLDWHEFACAAGSQFQVYGPLFIAFSGRPDLVSAAYDAYFPEVAALHVLLDAFIDQAEDAAFGELNFAAVYDGPHRFRERVRELTATAAAKFDDLPTPEHHLFVLRAMALFYLTHPKVYEQNLDAEAQRLLAGIA